MSFFAAYGVVVVGGGADGNVVSVVYRTVSSCQADSQSHACTSFRFFVCFSFCIRFRLVCIGDGEISSPQRKSKPKWSTIDAPYIILFYSTAHLP